MKQLPWATYGDLINKIFIFTASLIMKQGSNSSNDLTQEVFTQYVNRIKDHEEYESMLPLLSVCLEGSIDKLMDRKYNLSRFAIHYLILIAAANGHSQAVL